MWYAKNKFLKKSLQLNFHVCPHVWSRMLGNHWRSMVAKIEFLSKISGVTFLETLRTTDLRNVSCLKRHIASHFDSDITSMWSECSRIKNHYTEPSNQENWQKTYWVYKVKRLLVIVYNHSCSYLRIYPVLVIAITCTRTL